MPNHIASGLLKIVQ